MPFSNTNRMKKIAFAISCVILIASCNSNDKKVNAVNDRDKNARDSMEAVRNTQVLRDTANYTKIQWLDSTFLDLGKVKEGQVVEVSYKFKNIGNKPLIVTSVRASCGCTVPEKPEEPFAPGQQGVIKAKFDSKGKQGTNQKEVYVTANTNPIEHVLTFRVEVTE